MNHVCRLHLRVLPEKTEPVGMKVSTLNWASVAGLVGRMVLALAVAVGGYLLVYRPLQVKWGATEDEAVQRMPGDELQTEPILNATRAVTIEARPEQIWPWLVQIGYRRAGWYGYDWVDNDGIASATRILPQWQGLKVGDKVPIWRGLDFPVRRMEVNRCLVFASDDGKNSMALELFPVSLASTRLVWRVRFAAYDWKSRLIFTQLFTDMADFIAVRQNLLGIQARAEGKTQEPPVRMHGQLILWFVSFVLFVLAEIGLITRRELWGPLLAAMATGLITVFLVMADLSVWVDVGGVLAGVMCLRLAFRRVNGGRGQTAGNRSSYNREQSPRVKTVETQTGI
jgi:membrane protein implicated in regulation of membrane protease activity